VEKGKEIILLKLQNATGSYVEVCNYGASIVSIVLPDRQGKMENIILRYHRIEDYLSDKFYLGSTVGRFANRIAQAQFQLNGKSHHLDKNDGNHSNHGGFSGFHSRRFDYQEEDGKIIFSYMSCDGEGGFPGNLHFKVIYSFSDNNELSIEYQAISDQETLFNPTNHAYFNLSAGKTSILNHELKIYADRYLEMNDEFIPTGKILPIAESAFDFRDYRSFAELMPFKKEILPGYNTYFISNSDEELKRLASLRESASGRCLEIYATTPGFQLYTGDYLSEPFYPFAGLALEAQSYPDSPNHIHFPSCVLYPEKAARSMVKFCFLDV